MPVCFSSLVAILLRFALKGLVFSSFLFSSSVLSAALDDFVITIKSDNTGSSSDVQFTLPTTGSGYNYNIDCNNDGTDEATAQTAGYTCDYTSLGGAGTYTVRVEDNSGIRTGFPRIYFNNVGDKEKLLTIEQWGTSIWTSMDSAFKGASNLTTTATDSPDFSSVTSLSYMFSDATQTTPNTSNWDTSTITHMQYMFNNASSAVPDTSGWDTSAVVDMQSMFYNAISADPDVSDWDVSSVVNMNGMFFNADSSKPRTSAWNTVSVTEMQNMFENTALANPFVKGWNVANVTNFSMMFSGALSANPDVSGWNVANVTNFSDMFSGSALSIGHYDALLIGWNAQILNSGVSFSAGGAKYCLGEAARANMIATDSWTMTDGGKDCLLTHFVTTWKTDNSGSSSSTSITIPTRFAGYSYQVDWNNDGDLLDAGETTVHTGGVTHDFGTPGTYTIRIVGSFPRIYFNNSDDKLKILSIEQWGTGAWDDMEKAFSGAANLTVPATDTPNFSAVTVTALMFSDAALANPITSNWDVSLVTDMDAMFRNASVANPDVSNWNTSSVINMKSVFRDATSANPDVSNWDTGAVTEFFSMFKGATSATPNVSNWNVSSTTSFWSMFEGATSSNPDVSNWNTSAAVDMDSMFRDASSANPDVSSFDVTSVTYMDNMFNGATLSIANYDALLASWDGQALQSSNNFHGGNSNYCFSESQRSNIISSNSWTITDAGKSCVIGDYADNNANPAPTTADYINIGVTGVITGNLAEINMGIDARTGPDVDTVAEIQTIVNLIVAGNVIEAYADNNSNPQPVVADYITAGVTAVITAILIEVNAAVDGLTGIDVDTVAEIQVIVDAIVAGNIIENYADNNVNPTPTVSDYSDVGVTGVSSGLLVEVNAVVGGLTGSDVDTAAEIQAIVDAIVAGNVIEDYADNNANPAPTVSDYSDAGVTSVNAGNLAIINALIDSKTGTQVDSPAEIQALVNTAAVAFITTWKTDNPGVSSSTQVTIPTTGAGYSYNVDWGDGNTDTAVTGGITHSYASAGTYTVMINGTFPRIFFNNGGDRQKIISIDQWGTGSWTSMGSAFHGTSNMTVPATDVPDLSSLSDLSFMFYRATLANPNTAGWDLSSVTNLRGMFIQASSATPNTSSWNVSSVTSMHSLFFLATSANPDVSSWNTSGVTDMQSMFYAASAATPNTSGWNTSLVTNMQFMFGAAPLANPNTSGWDVSKVTSMRSMFSGATSANPDVSGWDVSSVTDMNGMFGTATSATPDVSSWSVINVLDMAYLFYNATSVNPDVSSWNVSSVTNMGSMFNGATSANPDVSGWDVSSVTDMNGMFGTATSATPDVSSWNVSSVTDMDSMFNSATSANPDVSSWNVSNVTDMNDMFLNVTLSTVNYDALLSSWDAQSLQNGVSFHGGNSQYCFSGAKRSNMISSDSWVISDAGKSCVIENYADNNANPTPTVSDYSDAGVTGVSSGLLLEVNAAVDGLTGSDVDTAAKIQTVVDTIIAGNIIEAYADNNTNPAPTVSDYSEAGVTSVNAGNLAFINVLIDSKTGTQVDSPAEIQALVNTAAVAFITTWKTDNAGVSSSTQITIPTTGGGYSYNVDWGDGNTDTAVTGGITHDYASAGTYTVMINGTFPRIFFNRTGDKLKILSVEQWGTGSWTSMEAAFSGASNLTVPATDVPDLSNVTNMISMFWDAVLANPDVSGWDVSTVIYMNNLFLTAYAATPDVSSWDVSNVTNMSALFSNATSANPDVSSWDVSNVVYMNAMFNNATSAIPDVSSWDVSKTIQMNSLFKSATSANPDVTNWDVSSVTTMESMFAGVTLATPNTSSWDTSAVTNMHSMFLNATSANPDTSGWNTSLVTNMRSIFNGATSANPDVSSWNTSSVTSMYAMFFGAASATPDTSSWNTSAVTTMRSMFSGATAANPNTSGWVTSAVESMKFMFYNATSANPDTSSWNTSAVTEMNSMFSGATSAQPDTSSWNTSLVTSMEDMFSGATSANPVVSGWDISGVTSMDNMFSGVTLTTANYDALLSSWNAQSLQNGISFDGGNSRYCNGESDRGDMVASDSWTITDGGKSCPDMHFVTTWKTDNSGSSSSTSITIPTTGTGYLYDVDWDNDGNFDELGLTGSVTHDFGSTGTYTLRIRGDFPRIYINNVDDKEKILSVDQWGSGNWSSMQDAFYGAINLTVPATDAPVLTSVTSLRGMFRDASTMNQSIGHWNTSNVTNMLDMFNGASAFNQDISAWDTSKVFTMQGMFNNASAFNQNITWNTEALINMLSMFQGATSFNQPIGSWDTTDVTNMSYAFEGATSFNRDISGWDTGMVNVMVSMFQNATDFDQNLNSWDVSSVTNMSLMFSGVTLSKVNYDAILNSFDAQTLETGVLFSGGNSQYCSGKTARANMIASDSWVITDGGQNCIPVTPTTTPDLQVGSDSGNTSTDNVTSDNTPSFDYPCSNIGNTITLYSDNPTSGTSVASQVCTTIGIEVLTASTLADGIHNMSYTDTDSGDESAYSPSLLVKVDTTNPAIPSCSSTPTSANNSTSISTTCNGVETDARVTIANMICSPTYATASNTVSCSGTTGIGGGDISVSNDTISVTDLAGNNETAATTGLLIDNISPVVAQSNAIVTPTIDSTPSYSFSSTEAGSIAYSGSCSSPTSNAVSGTNTITFNTLSDGSYSDCRIRVTDAAGNLSNLLSISAFEVDSAGATLTETTSVSTPSADSTPSYSFSSTEAGSIAYSGSCSSPTSNAVSGSNTITFNTLSDGSYSDCGIRLTDSAGNLSNLLSISAFAIDSVGATLTETTPITTPTADSTPSYSFSSSEVGSITYSGSCSSATSIAVSGTNTVTFNTLSDGSYSDCRIRVTDAAGNLSNLLSVSTFEVDSAGATLTETTPVTSPIADSAPSYSFSSTEAGSITYSGSCSSPTSNAVSGTNTITFNTLSDGSYSDCRIRVTDAAGNLSNLLIVSAFEIDSAGPTLAETTPVTTPTANSTPSYSFSSTEAGSIAYTGSCSSPTSNAVSGTNTITFNELENGSYSDCGITVTDVAGNMSNLLLVSSFEVDRLLLSLETRLPSSVLQDEHLLVTQSVIGGKAPFEFRVDNLPEWLVLDTGTGQIKGTPDSTNIETYSDIVFHITDSEERAAKSVAFELRVIDINDSPIAEDDVFTLVEGGKGAINVLANDSDPDEGDLITIESVSSVLGNVTIVGDMLEYQTPIDFVGDDIISYTIVDSGGLTATAEVVVSITYDPELGLPPTLVLPDDVVVDATGLLTKVALGFATATDSLNNTISVSKSSDSYFQPGAHQVVWTAEDSRGRTTSASQSVWVHPLISIGSDTQVEEGGAVSIGVYLNGDSPIYPVVIDYTLSGSADENDHDLISNSITLAKGRLGRINFSTLSDDVIEGDETLDIQLSDTVNIGGKFTHSLIITEKPFAPDIRLKPFQAGMERYSILDTEGLVTIYMYLDTGSEDDFSYTWDASKEVVNLSNETSQFIFDPELVSTGNLVVNLDLRTAAGLSTTARVNLLITSEIQQPSQTIDCSVINEQESDGFLFMVEAEPQTCIMRGELALKSRSGGIQILEDELITLMETSQTIAGGVFDFVVFGKPEASTYQIVFPQRKPIPEEAVYLKFSTQLHEWFDFVITAEDQLFSTHSDQGRCPEPNDARWVEGLTAGDWCLKLIIKDGGPNDVDGIANGMVVDPGGLASLSVPIVSDNHDPVAKDDFYQLINAEQIELDVLDNDSDSDGDQLVVIEASADLGFADIVDGVIWYHPASVDFFGTDVITYVISDDMGGVDKAVASLDVIIGNSLPVAVNDTLTMLANSQSSIDVLSNDSDPDGDPLSLHKANTDSGQVEVRGDRLIVTPDKAFVGEIHISYFVIDPSGAMATAKVTVTVKEGEKVSVENNSGGVMSLSLFLLLLIFTQRYLFITSVNERSHY